MRITKLSLTNFRNHSKKSLEFSSDMTLIVGGNGAGKTNILEAIHLLARGGSWRTEDAGEMVGFEGEVGHVRGEIRDSDIGFSRVARQSQGNVSAQESSRSRSGRPFKSNSLGSGWKPTDGQFPREPMSSSQLSTVLTRGAVGGKRVAKVKYLVDGVARRKGDFIGRLKVVLFEPESLEIVIGDPQHRRLFLDETLSQTDREYARSLGVYHKALRTRNRLLQAIRDGKARVESLEYWEREMVKHGMAIQEKRRQMVEWLDGKMVEISVKYDASAMGEERLEQHREREIATGFTLIGPQRDDLQVNKNGNNGYNGQNGHNSYNNSSHFSHSNHSASLSSFGSRGEQRMAVLQLKLSEAKWIEEKTGETPVLLLDDIFSELDKEHDRMVGELVRGRQAIITATEIPKDYKENVTKIIELS